MALRLYNTITRRLEDFEPAENGVVGMYNCGPTVYSDPHIGNFRSFLLADLLRRVLDQRGYEVQQVMNITDVGHLTTDDVADAEGEDKLEKSAREQGLDPFQIARRYEEVFFENSDQLCIRRAHRYPRATEHIPEMIAMIGVLIESEHAYVVDGVGVYFRVGSFPSYGLLSGNTVEELHSGARIAVDDRKESALDFALWKIDEKHLMQWPSPWGKGFPGWHIECSAMSEKYLGSTFDIHTGGEDNIFPHHECERAQSLCGSDGEFARYWVHARHLLVDGQKMAKSADNFFTINDLIEKGFSGPEIRYTLIANHYRQPMNFKVEGLKGDARALSRLRAFRERLEETVKVGGGGSLPEGLADDLVRARARFDACVDDDLNISGALGVLHETVRALGRLEAGQAVAADILRFLAHTDEILSVIFPDVEDRPEDLSGEQKGWIREREEARSKGDFALADELRERLASSGILVEDGAQGTTWTRER